MDLDQLDLNPRIIAAVKKAKLKSVKEVLRFSGPDLQRVTSLSGPDVQYLLRTASSHLRGSSVSTALHLYQQKERFPEQHQRLSLGCPVLDGLLRGGLPLDGITELAGCSSAGKTQLALQLCLAVQFPQRHGGLEAGAVYVCTEDAFPSRRLQQLIAQQQCLRADVPGNVVEKIKFGNQIFIEHAADVDTLLGCMRKRVPVLLSRGMARLVVVDSVAAPFRCEFDGAASAHRAQCLQVLGAELRRLSCAFRSPVLCINQVGRPTPPPPRPVLRMGVWGRASRADPDPALPGDGGHRGAGSGSRAAWCQGRAGVSSPWDNLVQPAPDAADGRPSAPRRGCPGPTQPHLEGGLRPPPAALVLFLHSHLHGCARDAWDQVLLTWGLQMTSHIPRKPSSPVVQGTSPLSMPITALGSPRPMPPHLGAAPPSGFEMCLALRPRTHAPHCCAGCSGVSTMSSWNIQPLNEQFSPSCAWDRGPQPSRAHIPAQQALHLAPTGSSLLPGWCLCPKAPNTHTLGHSGPRSDEPLLTSSPP
ncbi:DNA repair protein XRCC3 isoform X1 [Camelus ferus]|uniref:DNA repair protein XRCC3 isoform X1 n=1 Tax=Camelus ferus TaxID=419612 RepID=A0A8B8T9B5_CAMFR|nr:DNA repair protein XRCC3 isoform X1 [Camelus ferus]XP_032338672.1 DNA repair protein XRCC3 isoform X1 [Camelus ferus]